MNLQLEIVSEKGVEIGVRPFGDMAVFLHNTTEERKKDGYNH